MQITKRRERGVTLVELMIAVALIGIGLLVSIYSFTGIQKSLQSSKGRTLAANIAQEKMQILMQKSYYEVLATTAPLFIVEPSTTIAYDPGYFPPEVIPEGGMTFTRYTYIQPVMENSGSIQTLPPDSQDTGMRQITVTVLWVTDTGDKFISLKNILNNPNTVMSNAILYGIVKDSSTLAPIANATVNAAENIGWRDTSSSTGSYSINLSPGTFNFQASAAGYYSSIAVLTTYTNTATPYTFYLRPISTGTIMGSAWINNHPVISQVVASTGASTNVEYVELYNPTTAPINMGTNAGSSTPNIWAVAFDANNHYHERQLVYISTYIPSYGYYLITNTGDGGGAGAAVHCDTITINGTIVSPDACWRYVGGTYPDYQHTLQCDDISGGSGCGTLQRAGGFGIGTNGGLAWTSLANVTKYDALAWTGSGTTPNSFETTPSTPTASASGMATGESFIRRVDTSPVIPSTIGNAYDSDNNNVDFRNYGASIPITPRTISTRRNPLTGSPAPGAIASAIDGLSVPSTATLTGNPPYAYFSIPGVATGTWTVFIDSGSVSAENSAVAVVANSTTTIYNTILSTAGVVGMISGRVTDALGSVIAGGITVTAGNTPITSGANGLYYLRLSTGTYDVTANPGNANSTYASMMQPAVIVSLGDVTSNVNFTLSQGGKIRGWISRDGVNPLPGVGVVAYDVNGIAQANEVSGTNGQFLLINLTTGTYTVTPVLDLKETSSPTSGAAVVTAGASVWSSSFTVSGAMGTITGNVTVSGLPIKSGVLIVASTAAITIPLPALNLARLTQAAIYADSSMENGTYALDVRGSTTTTYNMTAFYTTMSGSTPVTSTRTVSGITGTAGVTTSGVNFAW